MRFVPIRSVKIGTVIARNIYDDKGRILLNSGIELTDSLIKKLELNEIVGVHIHDDYSKGEIRDVISPELRQRATKEIQKVFKSIRHDVERSILALGSEEVNLRKKLKLKVDKNYLDKLDDVIESMLNELTHNKDAMLGLVDIKNMKSFVYQHSIQVTVISLMIGASMHMNKMMLKELAISAILHDIGLSFLPEKLLIYSGEWDEEDKASYKEHCRIGNEFIKENAALSAPCRMGILQHHEQYNGLGYPMGLKGTEIHLYARIIGLANMYDKMTSGVGLKLPIPPNEVIEYIMGNSGEGRWFDFEIANSFLHCVIPFPEGSLVRLSTNEKAVVARYNSSNPLRPVVKIITEGKTLEELETVDLMSPEHLNMTILKVVYE